MTGPRPEQRAFQAVPVLTNVFSFLSPQEQASVARVNNASNRASAQATWLAWPAPVRRAMTDAAAVSDRYNASGQERERERQLILYAEARELRLDSSRWVTITGRSLLLNRVAGLCLD